MEKAGISIIIPLYKGKKYLPQLLEMIRMNALYEDLYKVCDIEIVFINDYPAEQIQCRMDDTYYTMTCINNQTNLGIHESRIRGLRIAKSRYVIMLDQDDVICENWLYSQLQKIMETKSDYCVCNGWNGRFRVLWDEKTNYEEYVNDVSYYLAKKNAIISPGQVIINRDALPGEWMENVMKNNGADDLMLWVMALKKGYKFVLNNEYLFYHTPERSSHSIKICEMTDSIKEMKNVLLIQNMLSNREKELLQQKISEYALYYGEINEQKGYTDRFLKSYMRINETMQILQRWMKLKLLGFNIGRYLIEKNIKSTAIYGLGTLGELLYMDLFSNELEIKYGIDKCAKDYKKELTIHKVEEDLESVDIVIVTIINIDDNVLGDLKERLNCEVVLLETLLIRLEEEKIS